MITIFSVFTSANFLHPESDNLSDNKTEFLLKDLNLNHSLSPPESKVASNEQILSDPFQTDSNQVIDVDPQDLSQDPPPQLNNGKANTSLWVWANQSDIYQGDTTRLFFYINASDLTPVSNVNVSLELLNTTESWNVSITDGLGQFDYAVNNASTGLWIFNATLEETISYNASNNLITLHLNPPSLSNPRETNTVASLPQYHFSQTDDTLSFNIELSVDTTAPKTWENSRIYIRESIYGLVLKELSLEGQPNVSPITFAIILSDIELGWWTRSGVWDLTIVYPGADNTGFTPDFAPSNTTITTYWYDNLPMMDVDMPSTNLLRTNDSIFLNISLNQAYPDHIINVTLFNSTTVIYAENVSATADLIPLTIPTNFNWPLGEIDGQVTLLNPFTGLNATGIQSVPTFTIRGTLDFQLLIDTEVVIERILSWQLAFFLQDNPTPSLEANVTLWINNTEIGEYFASEGDVESTWIPSAAITPGIYQFLWECRPAHPYIPAANFSTLVTVLPSTPQFVYAYLIPDDQNLRQFTIETKVWDVVTIQEVILKVNGTPYSLSKSDQVWTGAVLLDFGIQNLSLVATNIHNVSSEISLGIVQFEDDLLQRPYSEGFNTTQQTYLSVSLLSTALEFLLPQLTVLVVLGVTLGILIIVNYIYYNKRGKYIEK